MHWLNGSRKDTSLYKLWENLGAINENTPIRINDPFAAYNDNGQMVCLYRDPDKLLNHFLSVSPEDAKEVEDLCNEIKNFCKTNMMPEKYNNISTLEYTKKFKSLAIRTLLQNLMPGYNATVLLFILGTLASGDGGYIEGGSLQMARNIVHRFESLGGKIQINVCVQKIIIDGSKAVGVEVKGKGEEIMADAVIVTRDTLSAVDTLFDTPLHAPWIDEMRQNTKLMLDTFLCIGVEADMSDLPHAMHFSLDEPIVAAGIKSSSFGFYNYASYKGYAPEGCTSITAFHMGDTYDFWENAKKSGQYKAEKERFAKIMIDILAQKLPQIKGKIAVWDVAAPLTYERYCGTYKGSWMTIVGKGDKIVTYPNKVDGITNLYFAGQRLQPIGGLPAAADSGRRAVQCLCDDTNTLFQGIV